MRNRAEEYGSFTGTSDEVLEHLKDLCQNSSSIAQEIARILARKAAEEELRDPGGEIKEVSNDNATNHNPTNGRDFECVFEDEFTDLPDGYWNR